jgi:7-carboxy-7-deazaguanine synthase
VEPRAVVEWMLADRLPARFQLQMHKYIWPPEARGV